MRLRSTSVDSRHRPVGVIPAPMTSSTGFDPAAQVVDGDIARQPQQPREEWNAAILYFPIAYQLGEHVLRDVLGLVVVTDDAAHVAVHVVRSGRRGTRARRDRRPARA